MSYRLMKIDQDKVYRRAWHPLHFPSRHPRECMERTKVVRKKRVILVCVHQISNTVLKPNVFSYFLYRCIFRDLPLPYTSCYTMEGYLQPSHLRLSLSHSCSPGKKEATCWASHRTSLSSLFLPSLLLSVSTVLLFLNQTLEQSG